MGTSESPLSFSSPVTSLWTDVTGCYAVTLPLVMPCRKARLVFSGFLQTKCHQYWPDPPDIMDHGIFHIQCQAEDCTIAYVSREMLVTNTEVSRALRDMVEGKAQSVVPEGSGVELCCNVALVGRSVNKTLADREPACVCVCVCGGQRLTSVIFLGHSTH